MSTRRAHRYAMIGLIWMALSALVLPAPAHAGEASVLDGSAVANANGTYSFSATVSHRDTGWSHYADRWDVLAPDGKVLGSRVLYHPHVDEQPFTRSLAGVTVPIGITEVTLRAHCLVDGDGTRTFKLTLPPRK